MRGPDSRNDLWKSAITVHRKLKAGGNIRNNPLRNIGSLQFDFVNDWTAELQPARLGQRPTLGQWDSDTPSCDVIVVAYAAARQPAA